MAGQRVRVGVGDPEMAGRRLAADDARGLGVIRRARRRRLIGRGRGSLFGVQNLVWRLADRARRQDLGAAVVERHWPDIAGAWALDGVGRNVRGRRIGVAIVRAARSEVAALLLRPAARSEEVEAAAEVGPDAAQVGRARAVEGVAREIAKGLRAAASHSIRADAAAAAAHVHDRYVSAAARNRIRSDAALPGRHGRGNASAAGYRRGRGRGGRGCAGRALRDVVEQLLGRRDALADVGHATATAA